MNLKMDNKTLFPQGNYQNGSILIFEVVIIFIFSLVILSILSGAVYQLRVLRSTNYRESAFHIAEAGVNYYQWRLAHFPTDFQDGTGQAGPYVHDYRDTDTQEIIGQYSLVITPPLIGSTVVTIESTAWTIANPSIKRVITTRYGIPSLARYAFLTNSDVWIGSSESVSGEMHANGGIRFDGNGNAPIQSAKQTYTCPSWSGSPCPTTKNGIWGSAPVGTQSFWTYPVPNVDFSTITSDLSTIKASATTSGIYLPPSNAQGYSIVFKSTGRLDIYKVNTLRSHATGTDVNGGSHPENLDYNSRTIVSGYSDILMPSNGLIYIEDRTWVEGTVNGRAMVAAAKLPYNSSTAPSILIPNNLVYLAKDGNHSLGLIGQKDILITYFAPSVLEVDAAIIAQNGSAQRYYFSGNVKTSITTYGSIGSFGTWTWSWVNGSGTVTSGYQTTNTTYDANLLYSPPPSFPLTNNGYQQIGWASN
jgi:hypothetical protein